MYYSIVGDIISSKTLEERSQVQSKLEDYLEKLNKEYSDILKKRLSITLGDEFQGLFITFQGLMEIIHKIEVVMWPTKLRFGIGVGDMSFDFGSYNSPYQSDGEVWWNARQAIDSIKLNKSKNKLLEFSNIYVVTTNELLNKHINSVLNLCYAINKNWTEKQRNLINYTIKKNGLNSEFVISDLAEEFKQSVSTIYNKFKSAKYLNYVNALMSLNILLNIGDEKNVI